MSSIPDPRRALAAALVALALAATPVRAHAAPAFRAIGNTAIPLAAVAIRFVTLPLAWMLRTPGEPRRETWPESGRLVKSQGWRQLGFPLAEPGHGLMIEVRGRTEFRAVEILFDDGELRRVNLGSGRAYGRGLYELASFERERRVRLVRCQARAKSTRADVRVLLLRDAAPSPAAMRSATDDPAAFLDLR